MFDQFGRRDPMWNYLNRSIQVNLQASAMKQGGESDAAIAEATEFTKRSGVRIGRKILTAEEFEASKDKQKLEARRRGFLGLAMTGAMGLVNPNPNQRIKLGGY